MHRRWRIMLIALTLIVLAIVISLLTQIDDWSRDLTTNRAATSLDASDPTLRSLEVTASPTEIEAAIAEWVEQSSAWKFHPNPEREQATLELVRTTKIFRFADDVQVFLQPTDSGTRIDVRSQSRVGKGDLGQNPRNIRELLDAIREAVE